MSLRTDKVAEIQPCTVDELFAAHEQTLDLALTTWLHQLDTIKPTDVTRDQVVTAIKTLVRKVLRGDIT